MTGLIHGAQMFLWWLLVAALISGFVWVSLRMPPRLSPEEQLRRRFARGEMDEAEYRRRLAALRDALR